MKHLEFTRRTHHPTWRTRVSSTAPEDEVDRPHQAQRRPDKIPAKGLAHPEQRKRHEDAERDHLLGDLQLRQAHALGVADAVGRHLQQVLEERDPPARERRDEPLPVVEVLQVRVPGERHEHVAESQQDRGHQIRPHKSPLCLLISGDELRFTRYGLFAMKPIVNMSVLSDPIYKTLNRRYGSINHE